MDQHGHLLEILREPGGARHFQSVLDSVRREALRNFSRIYQNGRGDPMDTAVAGILVMFTEYLHDTQAQERWQVMRGFMKHLEKKSREFSH